MNKCDKSDSKATDICIEKLLSLQKAAIQSPKKKGNNSSFKGTSPLVKRSKKGVSIIEHPQLDKWLQSKGVITTGEAKKEDKISTKSIESPKPPTYSKENLKIERKHQRRLKKNAKEKSSLQQSSLEKHIKTGKNKKTSFKRSESSDSCDLPTFKNNTKSKTRTQQSNFDEKYGMNLPTVEEILKDKRDLEEYRSKVLSFQPLNESFLESAFSTSSLNGATEFHEEILDCKHLSSRKIARYFKNHLEYLSGIFTGEIPNERHQRYYDKTRKPMSLTTKDLTYNISTIVFSYDQKEQMVNLLKEHLDPDDTKTEYFFQVLLPELCLLIFMDSHKKSRQEAVVYLDKRPITEDD